MWKNLKTTHVFLDTVKETLLQLMAIPSFQERTQPTIIFVLKFLSNQLHMMGDMLGW